MSGGWGRHVLLGISVAVGAIGAIGSASTGDLPGNGDSWGLGVSFVGCALLGWTVVGRRRELPIGWLVLVGGTVGVVAFTSSWWAFQSLVRDPGGLGGGAIAAWSAMWSSALPWPLVLVAPLVLFPSGRSRSRRWRRFAIVVFAVIGLLLAAAAVIAAPVAMRAPAELVVSRGTDPAAEAAAGLQAMARLVAFAATLVALAGVVAGARRARGEERRAHSTVLAGAAIVLAMFVVDAVTPVVTGHRVAVPEAVTALVVLALPISIAVAVVRFQVFELRALVDRSVLLALTGVLLAVAYLSVLALLALATRERTALSAPSILAAGVVVVIGAPVARAAARMTRRWFGRDTTPSAMATRFAEEVAADDGPLAHARALVTMLRNELRLGSAELVVNGVAHASVGDPVGPVTSVGLCYGRRRVGELHLTARPGELLGAADRRTIDDIAGYLSIAVEAMRAGEALRHAQHALEGAQSEERRRVRRDLHDDVGPTLASARLKLAAHRRGLSDDTEVGEVIDQIADAIRGIRRVVDGLQPSVLEDVGLVPALQILLTDVRRTTGLQVVFEASPLPELTSAASGAAYRVIAEALANVVRHSGATSCTIRVGHDGSLLRVEVVDDGRGFDRRLPTGMGLRNMVDRAGRADGVATISSAPGCGTAVVMEIPA